MRALISLFAAALLFAAGCSKTNDAAHQDSPAPPADQSATPSTMPPPDQPPPSDSTTPPPGDQQATPPEQQPSPLQPASQMPCDDCEALPFCRRNCMKNLYVGYVLDDVSQAIFHQANGRLLSALGKRLSLAPGQLYSVIDRIGNPSSASLPIALDFAHREGRLRSGDLLLLGTFGGGLTWATGLVCW